MLYKTPFKIYSQKRVFPLLKIKLPYYTKCHASCVPVDIIISLPFRGMLKSWVTFYSVYLACTVCTSDAVCSFTVCSSDAFLLLIFFWGGKGKVVCEVEPSIATKLWLRMLDFLY